MSDEVDPLGSVTRSKLHFFWLADCSGSMNANGKMQALNNAIHECIPATREANKSNAFADMMVRAIRFSTGAQWHLPTRTLFRGCRRLRFSLRLGHRPGGPRNQRLQTAP